MSDKHRRRPRRRRPRTKKNRRTETLRRVREDRQDDTLYAEAQRLYPPFSTVDAVAHAEVARTETPPPPPAAPPCSIL